MSVFSNYIHTRWNILTSPSWPPNKKKDRVCSNCFKLSHHKAQMLFVTCFVDWSNEWLDCVSLSLRTCISLLLCERVHRMSFMSQQMETSQDCLRALRLCPQFSELVVYPCHQLEQPLKDVPILVEQCRSVQFCAEVSFSTWLCLHFCYHTFKKNTLILKVRISAQRVLYCVTIQLRSWFLFKKHWLGIILKK